MPASMPASTTADPAVASTPASTPASTLADPVDPAPPAPRKFGFAALFAALCLAVLCQALDNTIIATAIPRITDEFDSLSDVGWYGSGYLLTTCAFQLSYGKLYNLFPIKWVFLAALGLFELGSLICGAAPNAVGLIMGRVVAGIGSGGIFSGATLIVANAVPLSQRPIYGGILGGMYAIASVAGPLMGGAFTEYVTWRLCFYINLPLGLVTAVAVILLVPNRHDPAINSRARLPIRDKLKELDLGGLVVLVPAVICILLAIQWGGAEYSWRDARIIALFVLGGLLLIAFVVDQRWQQDRATVPPTVVNRRTVWACCIFSFNLFGSFLAISYYLPIWFQAIKGDNATESGIHNLPSILGTVVLSILAGGVVFGIGYYTWACILASILATVGAGLLSTFTVDTSPAKWIGYQILYGAGCGVGLQQPLIAAQTALPPHQVAEGTAVIIFAQTLGGAIYIAVSQNVFNNKLIANVAAQGIPIKPADLLSQGATQLSNLVAPQYLNALQQAYNDSITQTFYVAVAAAGLSILGSVLIPWLSVKTPQAHEPVTEVAAETNEKVEPAILP